MLGFSNSFIRSDTGVEIDSEPLQNSVFHVSCSAVSLYPRTKPLIQLHIKYKTFLLLKPCSYAQYTPRCKYTPGVYICTWGVFWSCKWCFMKMHRVLICTRVRICSTFVGGAKSVEQISTRVHICLKMQIA